MHDPLVLLLQEWDTHPQAQLCDLFKFCYQSAFGGGHLLTDQDAAWQLFCREWDETAPSAQDAFTPLGGGFARFAIGPAKALGLPKEAYFRIFAQSAATLPPDGHARFDAAVRELCALCAEDVLPFAQAEAEDFYAGWLAAGSRPFSHSAEYRAAYAPAYRVVNADYAMLLPLLARVWPLREEGGTLAIEGRCGSGKTSLAARLSQLLDAPIVHMDDFFVPFAERTPARYQEPGGNVDYARFASEVLPFLGSGRAFSYGAFSCRTGRIEQSIKIAASPLVIVEGVYAMHPRFGSPYDVTAFCDVLPESQRGRILRRDGEELLRAFQERWIPLEEAYFSAYHIRERCDFVLWPGA